MNRVATGRPVGKPRGSRDEVDAPAEPSHFVALRRPGAQWPHAHVGPMDEDRAERVAASWRQTGMSASVTTQAIGVNLTNELEST